MRFEYRTEDVCARTIRFELDGEVIRNIEFLGGCNGNLKAISKLVDGLTVDQVLDKLSGNTCGSRDTSCADQLATAVQKAREGSLQAIA